MCPILDFYEEMSIRFIQNDYENGTQNTHTSISNIKMADSINISRMNKFNTSMDMTDLVDFKKETEVDKQIMEQKEESSQEN